MNKATDVAVLPDPVEDRHLIARILAEHAQVPGALLPILHDIQNTLGYVPPAAIGSIATALQMTRAEVHGVVSFYHHFRSAPAGRHIVKLCRAEACQARGARRLEQHVKAVLGVDYHQTTQDGAFSLEPVYCLGNCACGPAMQIDNSIYGRVDSEVFDQVMSSCRSDSEEIE